MINKKKIEMEKMKEWLIRERKTVLVIILLLLLIGDCSSRRSIKRNTAQIENIMSIVQENQNTELMKMNDNIKHMELIYKINMYEFLKMQLDDNNKIVRTVVRPDDKIREYDDEIKKLREKLDEKTLQ